MYGGYSSSFNSTETWLRGGWYTDANGMVEVTTVYPGFYDDRAPHIHLMVHKDWIQSTNGFVHRALDPCRPELILGLSSLVSHSGTLMHTGQVFFQENWNDQVFRTSPYSLNTNPRTLNSQDQFLGDASRNGYSPFARCV